MVRLLLAAAVVALAVSAPGALGAGSKSGAYSFRMPSGNIHCAYQHYDFAPILLRCEIRSGVKPLPPRPKSCGDADWGAGYSMKRTGKAYVLCITDTVYDPHSKVFRYGTTWRGGGFTCTSKTTGLRCWNRSKHGFFLSREHSYAF